MKRTLSQQTSIPQKCPECIHIKDHSSVEFILSGSSAETHDITGSRTNPAITCISSARTLHVDNTIYNNCIYNTKSSSSSSSSSSSKVLEGCKDYINVNNTATMTSTVATTTMITTTTSKDYNESVYNSSSKKGIKFVSHNHQTLFNCDSASASSSSSSSSSSQKGLTSTSHKEMLSVQLASNDTLASSTHDILLQQQQQQQQLTRPLVPVLSTTSLSLKSNTCVTSVLPSTQTSSLSIPSPQSEVIPYIPPLNFYNKTNKKKKVILIVDDSSMNRRMLHRILKSKGFICMEANDGLEAVRYIQSMCNIMSNSMSDGMSESLDMFDSRQPSIDIIPHVSSKGTISKDMSFKTDKYMSQKMDNSMSQKIDKPISLSTQSSQIDIQSLLLPSEVSRLTDRSDTVTFNSDTGCTDIPYPYIDVILMDFMMPHMDGPTATAEIRKLGYTGPIIGATGNALKADIDHFIVNGANTVLIKPLSTNILLCTLNQFNV